MLWTCCERNVEVCVKIPGGQRAVRLRDFDLVLIIEIVNAVSDERCDLLN